MEPFIERNSMHRVLSFENLMHATVISRPNRFIVKANVNGAIENVHIHDPGRLEELIFPGNDIIIRETSGTKTKYSVTFCKNGNIYTFNDARFHSPIASQFIKEGYSNEVTVGDSRIDFKYKNSFIEVKTATLVENGLALYPDAVTERGTRHLHRLIELKRQGFDSYVLFLIFNENAISFLPNFERDKKFADAFYRAKDCGVKYKFLKFKNDENSIFFSNEIFLTD
ncbi:MAG: DNA/RNA nuclease SfsA [Ferroplasma sp.]